MLTISRIETKLKEIGNSFNNLRPKEKTQSIKKTFSSFFSSEPTLSVYANQMGEDFDLYVTEDYEFLYDLIVIQVLDEDSDTGICTFQRTILALESELKHDLKQVMDDFQKLLIANSDYKVIVFSCISEELIDYESLMRKSILQYRNSNGVFYLVAFIPDLSEFKVIEIRTGIL